MDRKVFDMSEFYREARAAANSERVPDTRGRITCPGNDDKRPVECDCALTMVFINMQPIEEIYSPGDAFRNGTLFENLNKPFLGGIRR